jgi:hypothetical protein
LLSELADSKRLDALVPPISAAYANQILRCAYLDILRRLHGRGAAKAVSYMADLEKLPITDAPTAIRKGDWNAHRSRTINFDGVPRAAASRRDVAYVLIPDIMSESRCSEAFTPSTARPRDAL